MPWLNDDAAITLPSSQWTAVCAALQAYIPRLGRKESGTRADAVAALQNIDAQMRESEELAPLDDLMPDGGELCPTCNAGPL